MESAVGCNDVKGKVRTLCGLYLNDHNTVAKNPDGMVDVTCKRCIKIIKKGPINMV